VNGAAKCGDCAYFEARPASLETGLKLLRVLASAHASTRADDGYCEHHDRYIRAAAQCATFTPAESR
jgi:hypothetical protein